MCSGILKNNVKIEINRLKKALPWGKIKVGLLQKP